MSSDDLRTEHLRVIADSVPALLSYVDDGFTYRWTNRQYERWFGHRCEDIRGRHVRDVLGPEAWEAVRPYMQRALAGEVVTYEQELPYRGSGPLWVRVTYTPDASPDGGVRGFSVLVHDIGEQKKAQERIEALTDDLRARVEELQRLFELLPVGVFLGHDPECARVTMNPAGAAMLGVPPGENPSPTGPDGKRVPYRAYRGGVEVPPHELPMQRAARENMAVHGEELEIVRADGSRVDLWSFVAPLYDRHGAVRGALGAFVDTTERARAEAALRAREEEYRTLFDLASVGAAQADVQTGRFVKVNRRFCELTGLSESELLARTFRDITHPDDRERDTAAFEAAVAGEGGWQSEKRYLRPDGSVVWALVIGRVVRGADGRRLTLAHVIDITARKRAEQALHEAEERFRAAQELSLDGFTILRAVRDEDGSVVDFVWEFVNPTAGRLLHRAPEDLVGQRLLSVLPGNEASSQLFRRYVEVVETGRPHDYELYYDADGVCGWFRNMAVRIGDGVAVSFTDITERKALEAELQATVAELQREHRRKDEFLAMLAHELRNPLAAISNAAQLLQLLGESDSGSAAPRGVIERQVAQLTRLVDDLLDVSRITRGAVSVRRERVTAAAVAESALEMSRPAIERMRHRLEVRLCDEPLELNGDPARLAQAIANLLHNAAKYTDPGGTVQLVVERDGREAVFRVIDDGVGIPADMLPRIFEPFAQVDRTTTRAQGGLGIGLTIVRSLVELHGGRVEAHSPGLGRGTEMVVRLPLAEAAPRREQPQASAERPTPKGLRVLVIDDNQDAARTLGELLRARGHQVDVAFDGADGLACAARARPELVLLDLGMPGMDGFEVAGRLRAREVGREAMIVALTGWGDAEAKARGRAAGFDAHIVKPPTAELLDGVLARAAERRALRAVPDAR
jgi:two-component system CheB/CheR fusion protein